jgi:hypothetical protein
MTQPTPEAEDRPRLDNGLQAERYAPISDVALETAPPLLVALGRARIAAYLDEQPRAGDRRRLFVDADERADARTVVAAAFRGLGLEPEEAPTDADEPTRPLPVDPDSIPDTDAAFDALVADWHVDTVRAIRDAERDLSREDAEWRARLRPSTPEPVWIEDDHYIPPPAPPLPRFAAPTVLAMAILALSILVLGLGGEFGLANDLTILLGVGGVLAAAGILIMRLRPDHEDDEDGSAL